MPNEISLTVRLPSELNLQLQSVAKELGMTKTALIRSAIHDFLIKDDVVLDFSSVAGKKDRLVLNINQITYNILENTCKKNDQSMNAVIIAVCYLALERSAKWLQSAKQ
jgi:ribbon-helix-helix protein, copG family